MKISEMSVERRNLEIKRYAHLFALKRYKRRIPHASKREGWKYAKHHWRQYVPDAHRSCRYPRCDGGT